MPHFVKRFVVLSVSLFLSLVGCAGSKEGPTPSAPDVRQLNVEVPRTEVIRSSVLRLSLSPTRRLVADSAQLHFDGTLGGREIDATFGATLERPTDTSQLRVVWSIADTLWAEFGPLAGDAFQGQLRVVVLRGDNEVAVGSRDDMLVRFRSTPTPALEQSGLMDKRLDVHVNQRVPADARGLLSPDEGETVARIVRGEIRPTNGSIRSLAGETLSVEWSGGRDTGYLHIDPGVFGVQPGEFDATIDLVNQPRLGADVPGDQTYQLRGDIQPSFVSRLEPNAASRGQIITVAGRGFVPNNQSESYGMFFRYEGTFHPRDGSNPIPIGRAVQPSSSTESGSDQIERSPERVVAEDEARQPVWFRVTDQRELAGLGRRAGRFEGTITPVLFDQHGEQVGQPWEGSFRIKPTKQVMYVKFLPVFSRALETYGLRNVEGEIRDRMLKVLRETYAGYHVKVTAERPDDWAAYATIEVGGADPTGTRAFGFDNSFNGVAKDTGNLFLADYLGGVNAEAAEAFNNPYGGIFLNSFSYFSEELNPDSPGASPAFDRIFSPFMPELGGEPVSGAEWPNGERASAIEAAIDAMGNVVGNTAAHELGHSMGMTFVEQDRTRPTDIFHNQIPGPYLMDAGADRPFAERAELPGTEPAGFNQRNREYLERVIPKP